MEISSFLSQLLQNKCLVFLFAAVSHICVLLLSSSMLGQVGDWSFVTPTGIVVLLLNSY